jgi:hypothetical protein
VISAPIAVVLAFLLQRLIEDLSIAGEFFVGAGLIRSAQMTSEILLSGSDAKNPEAR